MSVKLLLDTNAWLDYLDAARERHQAADQLVRQSIRQGDTLLYALASAKDVYYTMRAASKRALRLELGRVDEDAALAAEGAAWDSVRSMRELATCVGADESDLWVAEKLHGMHRDFEDDLVVAAALRAKADVLVTSDEALLRHAPLAALAPEDALRFCERSE